MFKKIDEETARQLDDAEKLASSCEVLAEKFEEKTHCRLGKLVVDKGFNGKEKVEEKLHRRLGKLVVDEDLVKSGKIWPALKWLEFIPVRVEQRFDLNGFEMIGISNRFRYVPEGGAAMRYIIVTEFKEDGSMKYRLE